MVGTDGYVLHTLFTNIGWVYHIRMNISPFHSVTFCFAITWHLFPDDVHQKVMKTMIWFCLLFTLINLVTPPIIFTGLLNVFLGAMFICIFYALFVVNWRAARSASEAGRSMRW